jgi:hypothetical protein
MSELSFSSTCQEAAKFCCVSEKDLYYRIDQFLSSCQQIAKVKSIPLEDLILKISWFVISWDAPLAYQDETSGSLFPGDPDKHMLKVTSYPNDVNTANYRGVFFSLHREVIWIHKSGGCSDFLYDGCHRTIPAKVIKAYPVTLLKRLKENS